MSNEKGKAGRKKAMEAKNITRRALIEAGWILPAVIVVAIPSKAFAEYGGPVPDTSPKGSDGSQGAGGGEDAGSKFHSDP
ncbi:MAG TPA: hypothetical protein VK881_01215 [bacterium]|nr:hypothetical protein [bacterium]